MKTQKLLVVITMMMAAISASAQYEPGTFSVQPRLGFTLSKISHIHPVRLESGVTLDTHPIGGLIIGADMDYQLSELFSLSAGINWAMAGCGWEDYEKKENGLTYELNDPRIQTAYLNIPVTANFYVWKGLALRTGLQMGFLTVANLMETVNISGSHDGKNVKMSIDTDESVKNQFNKFDLSIPVGVSYEFNNHLVLDARYNIGITKVNKDSEPGGKDNHNGSFSITIGYKIKL